MNKPFPLKQLSLCVALAIHGWACAQQGPAAEAPAQSAPLSTITVTGKSERETTEGTGSYTTPATRTATPLALSPRETPQSISVMTQQRIEDQGLKNITGVLQNITGVAVHQYETNRAQFVSRGFDINTLMIDGVPTSWEQPWSSGEVFTSLVMFDRVEVVRGATGLTTGAGEPSAAVNMVRKRASATLLTGSGELELGNYGHKRVAADVSAPLNEARTLRLRAVAEYADDDSWVDMLTNTSKTAFVTAELDLTPRTLLTAGVARQDNDSNSAMWGGLTVWHRDGSRTDWDRSKTSSADWVRWDSVYDNYFARLEHRFGNGWNVAAYYANGDRKADSRLLYLATPDPDWVTTTADLTAFPGSYKVRTQQDDFALTASGPFELLGRRHELAVGYNYSKQDFKADTRFSDTFTPVDDFDSYDGHYPEPNWSPLTEYGDGVTKQQALYAVARFNLADRWKLILGTRLTDYEKSADDIYSEPYSIKYDSELTPYAGLVFDINDNYSAYASYSDIFQAQNARDIDGNPLDPIKGKAGELGVKGEFFNGKLNASAAVFHIRQDNLAQATGQNIPGSNPPEAAYRGSKGATSKGFEFDLSGEIARGWNASAGYSQFKLTDADGNDINTIYPRKLLRVFSSYRLSGALAGLTLGGGVNWESESYTVGAKPRNVAGEPVVMEKVNQGSFALVNLMARYQFSDQWSAQLNVDNVFDKQYFRMFDAYDQATYGAPRTATVSVKYDF